MDCSQLGQQSVDAFLSYPSFFVLPLWLLYNEKRVPCVASLADGEMKGQCLMNIFLQLVYIF